jgi:hypothetical protein
VVPLAPTLITSGKEAGKLLQSQPSLPAADVRTAPLLRAYCTALRRADESSTPDRLMLITFAPRSAAQTMPFASSE